MAPAAKKHSRVRARQRTMGFVNAHNRADIPGGLLGVFLRLLIRFFQFVLGLAVCGLYGTDLDAARKHGVYADPLWVYAVVLGGLSSLTALVYLLPNGAWYKLFAFDFCLFIAWTVLFGIFGKMYIHEDPENTGHGDGPAIQRMKDAVWVDLTNMLLWFVSACWSLFIWYIPRRTIHTGRAAE